MIMNNQDEKLDIKTLLDYYNIELEYFKSKNLKSINGIIQKKEFNKFFSSKIKEIILSDKKINILEISNYFNSILNNYDLEEFLNTLFNTFYEINNILRDYIQELLNNDNFNINQLINIFNNYTKKFNYFKKHFYLLKNFVIQKSKTKFIQNDNDYMNIIKNYLFYRIILEKKYNYRNESKFLYEILLQNKIINQDMDFISLLKFHNSYCNHTFLVKSNIERQKIFNNEIINIFDNLKFISKSKLDSFLININTQITTIKISNKENIKKSDISNVIDLIKICLKFGDDIYFLHNYRIYLEKRILNQNNNEVELDFIKIINFKLYTDYYISMIFMINDILASEYLKSCRRLNKRHVVYLASL